MTPATSRFLSAFLVMALGSRLTVRRQAAKETKVPLNRPPKPLVNVVKLHVPGGGWVSLTFDRPRVDGINTLTALSGKPTE